MNIKTITLKNFKRFTDLTINLSVSPVLPKLVLLVGANGSGKSAVFDAFEAITQTRIVPYINTQYYLKNKQEKSEVRLEFENNEFTICILPTKDNLPVYSNSSIDFTPSFYGRSAVRYLPRLTRTNIQAIDVAQNSDKPNYYIDMDNRFENDLDVQMNETLKVVFSRVNTNTDTNDLAADIKSFLSQINEPLRRIFGDNPTTSLKFTSLLPPADGIPIQLMFQKGTSEIHYDVLSSGEKEVVNIMFNLLVRTPHYPNTIYFFDELDTHLHTELQYKLIQEIVEHWIPDDSQIWTASHSLGFIQYAKSSEHAAIIDFDNLDFDQSQILVPTDEQEVFTIAVHSEILPSLFKDKHIVFCENEDARIYNSVALPNAVFIGVHDKTEVVARVKNTEKVYGVIDRDYLSDSDCIQLKKKLSALVILNYYSIENYLYHPENIREKYPDFDVRAYIQNITTIKNKELDRIIQKLDSNRKSYIFFKNSTLNADSHFPEVKRMIESDDFETFYKVFSMKHHKDICGIPNVSSADLAKTHWFGSAINGMLPTNTNL
jgi:energy-coupling factor transporter ATP-binding protein EcfA2